MVRIERICTQSTGGRGNTCATFDRTGRFLLVTRYWEGGISVLPFDPDTGAIGEVTAAQTTRVWDRTPYVSQRLILTVSTAIPNEPGIRDGFGHRQDSPVHAGHRDGDTGAARRSRASPWVRPARRQLHPSLRVAYVNCELDGTVAVCVVDDDKGLVPVQTVHCYPEGFEGAGHPDNLGKADFWARKAACRRMRHTTTTSAESTRALQCAAWDLPTAN